ncbi:aldo/keto reductase [Vibrio sp. SS-MA-C1-2]|uniref:aldo/keto reductase n=1 Tax=Vibrio sp. SS-MA-C1-2 TaxID=2908646 RepID=UPI001F31EE04|nr:aldo/keto reductase [Vibrio sp. SS-MA-C1-2]UJF17863.1 aldo/keto reductase [Vibrio sp. SS-MA-C1-2]
MTKIADKKLAPIALGCMNLSHAYGLAPSKEHGMKVLNQALDLGYDMLDTAALYGFGLNEELLAKAVGHRRDEFFLASKCGMFKGDNGLRTIDGRPKTLRKNCEDSLKRLNTDVIDLYYLHRWDKSVPIEESVGELSRLVDEGKVKHLGLSEVSAKTLCLANQVHPIAAVQSEYSLWSRNPEIAIIEKCQELGTTFVSFSPVGRGILTGKVKSNQFVEKDIRRAMPRFSEPNFTQNLGLIEQLQPLLIQFGAENSTQPQPTLAQLALAWTLTKCPNSIALPGTTNFQHLEENWLAQNYRLSLDLLAKINDLFNYQNVFGTRYNATTQLEIDTEEFI